MQAADRFSVSVLHDGQERVARSFATKAPVAEKWAGVAWSERDGLPAIDDALLWVACDLQDVITAGDHVILTGAVTDLATADGHPAGLPRRRLPAAALDLGRPSVDRGVADGLDVVAVGVEHEGRVVGGVVDRPRAGGAVVGAARGEAGGVEGVDRVVVGGEEGEVDAVHRRAAARHHPEAGLALLAEADHLRGGLGDHLDPERRQRHLVEGAGAVEVVDLDEDVVEHAGQATRGRPASASRRGT